MCNSETLIKSDKVFTVSDASALLKNVVESAFPEIKIRGELSGITKASSGHIYMTIKDAGAAISVIVWKHTPVSIKLEEGLEVIITGKFTIYPSRSNYQIIVSTIEMAGVGAILKMLEERKRKLAAEGLFDVNKKQKLPKLPNRIGVVTSPTGAAFQDIQNRLRERFPVHVLLFPATVQGVTAAADVVAGIKYFNQMKNVDVIIVARGGGALEDLLPFSEEIVVRAVADSGIPVVSGVGHEPDWMLIDFAADVRAPTPTGAAEIVVPTKLSLIQDIESVQHRLNVALSATLTKYKQQIQGINIKSPKQIFMESSQRLDDQEHRLNLVLSSMFSSIHQKILTVSNLNILIQNKLNSVKQVLGHQNQMLNSLSYKSVLQRGFAIVRDKDNQVITKKTSASAIASIEFSNGVLYLN